MVTDVPADARLKPREREIRAVHTKYNRVLLHRDRVNKKATVIGYG